MESCNFLLFFYLGFFFSSCMRRSTSEFIPKMRQIIKEEVIQAAAIKKDSIPYNTEICGFVKKF